MQEGHFFNRNEPIAPNHEIRCARRGRLTAWYFWWCWILPATLAAQLRTDPRVFDESARYTRERKYSTWTLSAGAGPNIFYSDLSDFTFVPKNNWKTGYHFSLAKQFHPAFALEAQWVQANFYGEKNRLYVQGNVIDYTLNVQAYLNQMVNLPGPIQDHWNFYLKLGLGMQSFRSRLFHAEDSRIAMVKDFTGEQTDNRYVVLGYNKTSPHEKVTRKGEWVLPLGVGVLYRLHNRWDVGLESTIRFAFEDNMDNVLLGATNDRYGYTSVMLNYNFGQKKSRHSKWTYRTYGFNILGKPKKDPLLSEIELLEEEIKKYEAHRPIQRDSVVIHQQMVKIYGRHNFFQLFFTPNSHTVVRSDLEEIARLAFILRDHPQYKVEIHGFSDSAEAEPGSTSLSAQRCRAVLDILVHDLGFQPERFILVPEGSSNMLSPVDRLSPRGLQLVNRRVDLILQKIKD